MASEPRVDMIVIVRRNAGNGVEIGVRKLKNHIEYEHYRSLANYWKERLACTTQSTGSTTQHPK